MLELGSISEQYCKGSINAINLLMRETEELNNTKFKSRKNINKNPYDLNECGGFKNKKQ